MSRKRVGHSLRLNSCGPASPPGARISLASHAYRTPRLEGGGPSARNMRHGAIGARDDHFDRGSVMSSIVKLASHRGPAAAGTGQAFLSPHGRLEKDEHLSLDAVFEGAAVE